MANEIGWQEAVARLTRERGLAENCARLLKQRGSADEVIRTGFAYNEAKAEYDGIVAGLVAALARRGLPESLADLVAQLARGFNKRTMFCEEVATLLPGPPTGVRSLNAEWVEGAVKGLVGPLLDALKSIWLRHADDNVLMRQTIATQLEAARWPEFAAITPDL